MRAHDLTPEIIGATITIHRKLGPGLLELPARLVWPMNLDNGA